MNPPRVEEPRYVPLVKIASGGMATVFVGALRGPLGFSQLVAIKRPHEHLLEDPSFRRSLLDEARLAARIRHAHVVDVRDVEVVGDSVQLVMDYVEGASLGQLIAAAGRAGRRLPPGVVSRIVLDACAGLSAVHDLTDDGGAPLGLVHRDVSPHNILVGLDGLARITDFGIAMAEHAAHTPTTTGLLKGKLGYMAPEYIRGGRPDRRADLFALGVVAWEALAGRRLFKGANEGDTFDRVLREEAPPVGREAPDTGGALDEIVARALSKDPDERLGTAEELGAALEDAAGRAGLLATHGEVAREVRAAVGELLEQRRREVRERQAALDAAPPQAAPPPADAPQSSRGGARRLVLPVLVISIALGGLVFWRFAGSAPPPSEAGVTADAAVPTLTATPSAPTLAAEPVPSVLSASPSPSSRPPEAKPSARTTPTSRTSSEPRVKPRTLPPNPYGR